MIKKLSKAILPLKLYNFIRLKPRITIISRSLHRKIKRINSEAWKNNPDNRGDTLGIIRKQAHIIDKGLQSPLRKPGHGIPLSAELRSNLDINSASAQHTTEWAKELLRHHSSLQENKLSAEEYSDFTIETRNNIAPQRILEFMKERRSIRHFEEGKLPTKEIIIKALEGAIWAPSSCNRQTIVNFFTVSPALSIKCAQQNKGATGLSGKFCFISVCYDTRSYHLPQESLTGMIDASLGAQNILLLIHSLGLGACVLNWSHADDIEDENLRSLLNIPNHCEIAFNIVVGFPKTGAPVPGKKIQSDYIIEAK